VLPITFYCPAASKNETAKPVMHRKTLMPVKLACDAWLAAQTYAQLTVEAERL